MNIDDILGLVAMEGIPYPVRSLVRGAVEAAHKDTRRTRDQKAFRISQLFHVDKDAVLKLV